MFIPLIVSIVALAFAVCALSLIATRTQCVSNGANEKSKYESESTLAAVFEMINAREAARVSNAIECTKKPTPTAVRTKGTLSRHFTTRDVDCALAEYVVVRGKTENLFSKQPKLNASLASTRCLVGETAIIGAEDEQEPISCAPSAKTRTFFAKDYAVGTRLLPCLARKSQSVANRLPWM